MGGEWGGEWASQREFKKVSVGKQAVGCGVKVHPVALSLCPFILNI